MEKHSQGAGREMGAGRAPERERGGFVWAGGLTSPCSSVHVRRELGRDWCERVFTDVMASMNEYYNAS